MVKNKFRKHIYLTTVALLVIVFIAGIIFGRNISSNEIDEISKFIKENELDTESYIIEQLLMESFEEGNCDLAEIRINSLFHELGFIGGKLSKEDIEGVIGKDNYAFLKRKYHLLQIKTYTLYKKLIDDCGFKPNIILYYYSINQEQSRKQGLILDRVVEDYNTSVFAIQYNYSKELNFLHDYYNITRTPATIVNYRIKNQGLIDYETLKKEIERSS